MPTLPLDDEALRHYYEELQRDNRIYRENKLYSEGKNPQIHNMAPTNDPDNRLAIPLGKMAIADLSGYAGALRTIEIDPVEEGLDISEFVDTVDEIYHINDTDRLTSMLYKEAITQGVAYEIVYTTERDGNRFFPEYAMVPRSQIVPLFSEELKPELLAFIWFRDVPDPNDSTKTITIADAYYGREQDGVIERWIGGDGSWQRDAGNDSAHLFDRPPLNIYSSNANHQSVFEAEKGLLFSIDKLLSKSINEVDRFNSNILITSGPLTDEDLGRIQEWSIMLGKQSGDESDPFYLSKNLTSVDSFYNQLADRLERLFHKSSKVPDFSDENFVGNSSGVALSFKLLGLEFLATDIDTFFDAGIRQRYDLILQSLNFVSDRYSPDDYRLVIRNQRDLPVDNQSRVQIAQTLLPIVSRETILRFLPDSIVDDAQRELDRIAEESGTGLPDVIDEEDQLFDTANENDDNDGAVSQNTDSYQRSALDGDQIRSIVEIANQVATGIIPRETAIEIVLVAIPSLSRDQANQLFSSIRVIRDSVET